jgi:DNA-binding XRE family transcriptional regulator
MTIPFAEIKERALKRPEVKAHYDALADRYAVVEAMITARIAAGLTQEELAKRMGTTQSAIARLEGGKISPSLETLYKYARALGARVVISFEPMAEART